jgi:RNA polymerase sigma-70 factor (ECF subfamily)
MDSERELVAAARAGTRSAFDRLAVEHLPALRSFVLRMVMHPQDADDLAQDALLQAYEKLTGFRGDSSFRTWLFTIATRKCIDHLRARRRWPVLAQTQVAGEHVASAERMADLTRAASVADHTYDYREHIAYCFACIGRTLEPEDAAALLLRDVFDLSNAEAARAVGVSTSVLRHRLAHARRQMTTTFEGLCALVGKQGACWQCAELRDALPVDRRGRAVQPLATADDDGAAAYRKRLPIVRAARLGAEGTGASPLHDYIIRYMSRTFD